MIALALGLLALACFVAFMSAWGEPVCGCGSRYQVARRRRMTQYENDEDNFTTGCLCCFEDEQDYWQERWDDYYAGCL